MLKIGYKLPFYLAILMFLVSLGLTAVSAEGNYYHGITCLLGGWMVFINEFSAFIAWFANITFIFSVVSGSSRKKKSKIVRGLIYSIMSIVLGLVALTMGTIDMGGTSDKLKNAELGPGYYVWMFAFILMLFAMIIRFQKSRVELNK